MRQSIQNRIRASGAGGGDRFDPGSFQMPDLSALSAKYLQDLPAIDIQTDPSKLYEEQIGGFRSDVQGAMTQAGQQAISMAAQSGREVSDVMARYLPEAVKGFGRGAADVATGASQLAQQGQVAKSELEQRRAGMANEMARFDASAQQQQFQFMADLQQKYQQHRAQMANNLRVAQSQATSQRQLQSIQNAHAMQMQQLKNQFAAQAQAYGESQANARQSMMLRTYDKWKQAGMIQAGRDQSLKGAGAVIEAPPTFTPPPNAGGLPRPSGTGSWSFGGRSGTFGGGGYTENDFQGRTINPNPALSPFEEMLKRIRAEQQLQASDYGYWDR
jgi:hypothetical protein